MQMGVAKVRIKQCRIRLNGNDSHLGIVRNKEKECMLLRFLGNSAGF